MDLHPLRFQLAGAALVVEELHNARLVGRDSDYDDQENTRSHLLQRGAQADGNQAGVEHFHGKGSQQDANNEIAIAGKEHAHIHAHQCVKGYRH